MSFRRDGDRVTIEMSINDWDSMIVALGIAGGVLIARGSPRESPRAFWRFTALVNRINQGNADFTPYTIPEEFQDAARP